MKLWLKKLSVWSSSFDLQNHTAFSAFHSQLPLDESFKTISTLFPLLLETISSPVMVRRCMKIIKGLADFLNPGQVRVINYRRPASLCPQKESTMDVSKSLYLNCVDNGSVTSWHGFS